MFKQVSRGGRSGRARYAHRNDRVEVGPNGFMKPDDLGLGNESFGERFEIILQRDPPEQCGRFSGAHHIAKRRSPDP
jgi:hypothetical protein